MASDFPQSLKKGTTDQTRAVVASVSAVNGVPGASSLMAPCGMTARIDLVLKETGGHAFTAKIWWWYSDAGVWVEDIALGSIACAANSTAGAILTPSAASGIYVQIATVSDPACVASAWLIGRGSIGRW